jgi:hypothetical protein
MVITQYDIFRIGANPERPAFLFQRSNTLLRHYQIRRGCSILDRKRKAVVEAYERWRSPESLSTSHSAMPLRVQYFRGLGGGSISCAAVKRSASKTRRPLKLDLGVSAPE